MVRLCSRLQERQSTSKRAVEGEIASWRNGLGGNGSTGYGGW